MKIKKYTLGFTLIELLVVISIVGILAAISLVSFTTSQRQARDTQRKSDLKQYSTSLESFANNNSSLYPSRTSAASLNATVCGDLGLTNCPADPKTTDPSFGYNYVSDGSGAPSMNATKYVLWAKLENTPYYWVVCSNGKVGTKASAGWSGPAAGTCPI